MYLNKMLQICNKQLLRIMFELILTVILIIVSFEFSTFWGRPTKRGFFCDDESIKYPYHEDTINSRMLYGYSVGIPVTIILIGELLQQLVIIQKPPVENLQWIRKLLLKCHDNITPFLFVMAAQKLISSVVKFSVGRLRPHFFAVCQPYLADNSTCDDPKNHGIYIQDYKCSDTTPNITTFMLSNAHLSFPSGHSSSIFYAMLFTVLYLQRFSKSLMHQYKLNISLLIPLLQMLCMLLAAFVAVSRVMDYKHHWSDVLFGILLGSISAIAVSFYVQQQIKREQTFLEGNQINTSTADTSMTFVTAMPNSIMVP